VSTSCSISASELAAVTWIRNPTSLFEHGVYVTLAAYPLVPKSEVGFRIQVTAANSEAEIEQLVDTLGKLANTFDLRPARQEYAA
jgi:hypothetical protein